MFQVFYETSSESGSKKDDSTEALKQQLLSRYQLHQPSCSQPITAKG